MTAFEKKQAEARATGPLLPKHATFMVGAAAAKFKTIGKKNNHRLWAKHRDEAKAAEKAQAIAKKEARLSLFYEAQTEKEESEIERRYASACFLHLASRMNESVLND